MIKITDDDDVEFLNGQMIREVRIERVDVDGGVSCDDLLVGEIGPLEFESGGQHFFGKFGDEFLSLHIGAPDLQAFTELMLRRVLRLPGVAHIKTNIGLQKVKQTHVLPLDHVAQLARPRSQLRYDGD